MIKPKLGIATYLLIHLYSTLQGDPTVDSPPSLSTEAQKALALVEKNVTSTSSFYNKYILSSCSLYCKHSSFSDRSHRAIL